MIGLHIPNEFFLKLALNMLKQRTQNAPPPFGRASAPTVEQPTISLMIGAWHTRTPTHSK
jgi:hypothetical protein